MCSGGVSTPPRPRRTTRDQRLIPKPTLPFAPTRRIIRASGFRPGGTATAPAEVVGGGAGRSYAAHSWQHIAAPLLTGRLRRSRIAQSFSTFQNTIESGALITFLRFTRIADGLFHTPQGM